MARANAYETPVGIAQHPWINKADTKYNEGGVFKVSLVFDGAIPEVQNLKALVDEQCEARFKELTKGLSAAEKKKWSVYKPYELEADSATGDETGRIIFSFKRNHTILIDGEAKNLKVAIYDSVGNVPAEGEEPSIFAGSTLQAAFTFRDVKVPGTHVAGAKLDFFAVKVHSLGKGKGGGFNWSNSDKQEADGYVYTPGANKRAAAGTPTDEPGTNAETNGSDYA